MKVIDLRHELRRTVWPSPREAVVLGLLVLLLNSMIGGAMMVLDTFLSAAIWRLLNI